MKLNEEVGLDTKRPRDHTGLTDEIRAPQEAEIRRPPSPALGTGRGQEQRRAHTAATGDGGAQGARRPSCAGGPRGQTIVFDIETGPLSDAELAAALPPFDPNEVKLGNLKDPEKIAAKLAEAEANHRRDFVEKAALDAMTGRVLAIGMLYLAPHPGPLPSAERGTAGEFVVIEHADEAQLLREFWVRCEHEMGRLNVMVGFNTHQFDLPFLVRRSWRHRVALPWNLRRGRYWSDQMIDLREAWQLGDRQAKGSLDAIAKHLDVGTKNGSGADFARLWQSDRPKAVEYLRNDLQLTAGVAKALGVV
jgi:3'-5' exonuclease